ncbi:response regulator [Thalassobacillus sp. CUG 92003]|uniref:response regulator n=1 Tax=Thalassobacillus sp. CUG 92003 TaxID=2736641 RepID=UPI0015E6EEF5|nr:response regulator [Thalassobacillus sp. CUG 92003]
MKKVMVVDDSPFMRQLLTDRLTSYGIEVVAEASDGTKVIPQYKDYHPDIVLMDVTMPGMSGSQAVKKLLEHDPAAKVIMCSASGQMYLVKESIHIGAKDFVIKPFFDNLISTVHEVGQT